MRPLLAFWLSMISAILALWTGGWYWILPLMPAACVRTRCALGGLFVGALLAVHSFKEKKAEVEILEGPPRFWFFECMNFRSARLVAPAVDGIDLRTRFDCPTSQGFVVFGRISIKKDLSWGLKSPPPRNFVSLLNSPPSLYAIRSSLSDKLSNDWPLQSGLRRALFLGDGSALSAAVWKTMNSLGLSHLLVASGMHLVVSSLVITRCLAFFLRWLLPPSLATIWIYRSALLFLVTLYSFLLGFDVSVARAWWLWLFTQGVVFAFPLFYRVRGDEALAAAGILIVGLNPLALFDVSFFLSFGASWFIQKTQSVALTSLAASLICSFWGLSSSLLSVFVNSLVAGPLFLWLIPLSCLAALSDSAAWGAEVLLSNILGLLRDLSWQLPLIQLSPNLSLIALCLLIVSCLLWCAKPSILKVYFDNSRLVSLTLRLLSRYKVLFNRERKRL